MLVSGTAVSGKPLALVIKIDSDGNITHEEVDFNMLHARHVYSDGEFLFAQVKNSLQVFKVKRSENESKTSFDLVAEVKLLEGE